jgi:hypothetical protein
MMFPVLARRPAAAARAIAGLAGCFVLPLILTGCASILESRLHANETAALAAVRTVHVVQVQYFSQFGHYAGSLQELEKAGLLAASLATGVKNGYHFQLAATQSGYTITAAPNAINESGRRSFYSDQTKVIHQHDGPGTATAEDPQIG